MGRGKTFCRVSRFFSLTKTAVTRKRKVEKLIPTCERDRLFEGYERAIDKKHPLLVGRHVLATKGQYCANKKVFFPQINMSLLVDFGCFYGRKRIFGQKNTFWSEVFLSCSQTRSFLQPSQTVTLQLHILFAVRTKYLGKVWTNKIRYYDRFLY